MHRRAPPPYADQLLNEAFETIAIDREEALRIQKQSQAMYAVAWAMYEKAQQQIREAGERLEKGRQRVASAKLQAVFTV